MGTVNTTTKATATAYGNQRKEERLSNGNLVVIYDGGNQSALEYKVSTDGGVTWSGGATVGPGMFGATYTVNSSIKRDEDDYLHVAYKDGGDGYIKYVRGTPNAGRTAWTWSAAKTIASDAVYNYPDIVAHREGTGWRVHIVYSYAASANAFLMYCRISIDSAGAMGDSAVQLGANRNINAYFYPSIDFNHTGDGVTVAGGTPHLYVGWSSGSTGSGNGIRFMKATYAAGSWTWGTEREIDNTRYVNNNPCWLNCMFDGTRVVLVGELYSASATFDVIAHDRDAADPSSGGTTVRNLVTTSSSTYIDRMNYGSASYNSTGDLYVFGVSGEVTAKLNYRVWTRATATLGALVTVDSTSPAAPYASARRGPQGQAIDYVYTDGTASPHEVKSGRILLNQNPTAATPLTPADNATIDSSVDQTVTFRHNDPDGDAASSWRIRYRPAGTTVPYAYLTGSTTAANGATVTATVPAGTWVGQIAWEPQTYDPSGAEGAWGVVRTVTGVPAALAALTGGQGGTSADALKLNNQSQNDRALRALSLI